MGNIQSPYIEGKGYVNLILGLRLIMRFVQTFDKPCMSCDVLNNYWSLCQVFSTKSGVISQKYGGGRKETEVTTVIHPFLHSSTLSSSSWAGEKGERTHYGPPIGKIWEG